MNSHVGIFGVCIRLLAKFEFPTRTPNKSRLNFRLGIVQTIELKFTNCQQAEKASEWGISLCFIRQCITTVVRNFSRHPGQCVCEK